MSAVDGAINSWAEARNPFYAGPHADWLALLPFILLTLFLYLVGREVLLAPKSEHTAPKY